MPTRQRILLVEDDPVQRDILEQVMVIAGYRVDTVPDGNNALVYIENARYDLVVLDLNLPDMEGMEVLKRTREIFSRIELPVLIVSALEDSNTIVHAMYQGANDYLTKPVRIVELRSRISAALKVRGRILHSMNPGFTRYMPPDNWTGSFSKDHHGHDCSS